MNVQTNLYELFDQKRWDKPLRVCELYGGIGSQIKALRNIGANISEHYLVEVDINATISYAAIHCELNKHLDDDVPNRNTMIQELEPYNWWNNEQPKDIKTLSQERLKILYLAQKLSNNFGDVMQLEDLPEVDLITWSTPCQDFSNAGKRAGFGGKKGSLTGATIELLKKLTHKPTFLLFENVPMIVSQKFRQGFNAMLDELNEIGYDNVVMKLNAKDYGIPQNRDRIFVLSVSKEYQANYSPPQPIPLQLRLKDMLQPKVDKKYFLTDVQIKHLQNAKFESMGIERVNNENGVCNTITTMGGGNREPMIARPINSMEYDGFKTISPTLKARDYKDPNWVYIAEATKKGYTEAYEGDGVYISMTDQKRGVVQTQMIPTIKTTQDVGVITTDLQIRKLTPLETWRLMGFTDTDFANAEQHHSNSALYKQAGNSIVVQVLEKILERIL